MKAESHHKESTSIALMEYHPSMSLDKSICVPSVINEPTSFNLESVFAKRSQLWDGVDEVCHFYSKKKLKRTLTFADINSLQRATPM